MSTHAAARDALLPRGPDRIGRGLLLALIVHVGLIIAIAIGVNWRSHPPEAMSAELWSAVPQTAAPKLIEPDTKPVPPPFVPLPKSTPVPVPPKVAPPPTQDIDDAQIAVEKAKREKDRQKQLADDEAKRERDEQRRKDQADKAAADKAAADKAAAEKQKQQQEADRKKKLEDAKREAEQKKAEDALRAQARKDQQRMMGLADATGEPGSKGTAKQSSGPSANYGGRVEARVRPNITYTEDPQTNPSAEFEVRAAPDGTILGTPRLTKSSGIPSWDDAAQRAIIKTQVLPRDVDGTVPSLLIIALRPRR
jgi:colicin import membrane protein